MLLIKRIITSSIFQSVLFGLIILAGFVWVWDAPIKKFKIEVEQDLTETIQQQFYWFAEDFNKDGNTEFIRCSYGQGSNRLDITHYDNSWNLIDQYHIFNSNWNFTLEPALYDINGDDSNELLFFTERNDSIFFNAYSLTEFRLTIDHLFFHELERKREEYSYKSRFYDFGDFNSDGIKELFFSFDAGFGLYPRGIFKIEFPSLQITSTETEYMAVLPSYIEDITGDNIPEIFSYCYAPSNTTNYKKYSDTISYFAVFDFQLKPLFEPIAFPGEYTYAYTIPSSKNDSIIYALVDSRSNNNTLSIYVLGAQGKIIKSKRIKTNQTSQIKGYTLLIHNNISYFFGRGAGHFKLDKELLEIPDKLDLNFLNVETPILDFDFNNDGTDEWISSKGLKDLVIYDEVSQETVSFETPVAIQGRLTIYPIYTNSIFQKYMADTSNGYFFFKYERNRFYFVLYLIYLAVFLVGSLSVWVIMYLQKRNIERKWQTEKQLTELQFNAVKNQLNPHFLFNALNSVALMINEGEAEEAYDFLSINSRMIQRVMDDSSRITRSLENEIQFTRDYINIQKRRFKERFDYSFIISPDVNLAFEVPKMCIHTYVENSVKHGFRNISANGILQIEIDTVNKGVRIVISDNGMGRKAASNYKDSSGNGIKIMNEFYQLFEKYHAYQISFVISDNNETEQELSGTTVELIIRKA